MRYPSDGKSAKCGDKSHDPGQDFSGLASLYLLLNGHGRQPDVSTKRFKLLVKSIQKAGFLFRCNRRKGGLEFVSDIEFSTGQFSA